MNSDEMRGRYFWITGRNMRGGSIRVPGVETQENIVIHSSAHRMQFFVFMSSTVLPNLTGQVVQLLRAHITLILLETS